MRIAAVQFHIHHRDKEDNWTRIEEFMLKASHANVDLIVFPEYVLGGPSKHMIEKTAPGVALDRCRELAKKYQMDLVPGTLIERDPTDGFVYNTAYYIDKSGDVLLSYRKVHLWSSEKTFLKESKDGFETVKNRFGIQVGLCICWDIAFPEVFREMAFKKHAQLIIAPTYWTLHSGHLLEMAQDSLSEAKFLDAICLTRCYENSVAFVLSNPAHEASVVRKQPSNILAGHSQIVVPLRGPIAHANHLKEDMIIADVDIKTFTDVSEEVYQVRKYFNEGLIYNSNNNDCTLKSSKI